MQVESGSAVSFCLSFNSYSCDRLAEIAGGVSREEVEVAATLSNYQREPEEEHEKDDARGGEEEEEDFEFTCLRMDPEASSGNSGGFLDGQIRQVFPVFNRDLLLNYGDGRYSGVDDVAAVETPLRNLFLEERNRPSPSSSPSEADEPDRETYCVWIPPKSPQPAGCKKSKSTGSSSRRWRLRGLLKRSHSDGKDSLVLWNPNSTMVKNKEDRNKEEKSGESSKAKKSPPRGDQVKGTTDVREKRGKEKEKVSAHEAFYVRSKAMKEGDKRRSYLPYKQDLVGFFANVNGLGRTFPPF